MGLSCSPTSWRIVPAPKLAALQLLLRQADKTALHGRKGIALDMLNVIQSHFFLQLRVSAEKTGSRCPSSAGIDLVPKQFSRCPQEVAG